MITIPNIFISAFYTLRIEKTVSFQLSSSNEMERIALSSNSGCQIPDFFIIADKIPK